MAGANASKDDDQKAQLDLTPDSLAASLSHPSDPFGSSSVPFVGLLADDDDSSYLRVYQDYELKTYVRLPRESVRHRERVRNSGGVEVSMVFVDAKAEVEIREVSSEQVQADLLSKALQAAESGAARGTTSLAATPTVTTVTPPVSAAVCTRIFCTNATCACTSRHSTLCSITCTNHPACPNPWTENWFCAARS